jgi:hypothetical protein
MLGEAVRDPDGKFGSGKNTRRFRRMPGLFRFQAYAAEPAPVVELPDGRRLAANDPTGHQAVGEVLSRTVTLVPVTCARGREVSSGCRPASGTGRRATIRPYEGNALKCGGNSWPWPIIVFYPTETRLPVRGCCA